MQHHPWSANQALTYLRVSQFNAEERLVPFGETLIGDFAHRRYMKITAKDGAELLAVFLIVKISTRTKL